MTTPVEIPLYEYENELGRHQLYAVVDELSLTYRVLVRDPDGRTRAVRQFIPSRRNARQWAAHYRDKQSTAGSKRAGGFPCITGSER
jgi:hypothetical protein